MNDVWVGLQSALSFLPAGCLCVMGVVVVTGGVEFLEKRYRDFKNREPVFML